MDLKVLQPLNLECPGEFKMLIVPVGGIHDQFSSKLDLRCQIACL